MVAVLTPVPSPLPPAIGPGAALLLYGLASGAWLAARALRGGGASSSSEGGGDFVEQLGKLVGGAADSVQGALHEVVPGWVRGGLGG